MNHSLAKKTSERGKSLPWVILVAAVLLGVYLFWYTAQSRWFQPRAKGLATQAALDEFIRQRDRTGFARVLFYFERIDIVGDDFTKEDILDMQQIVKENRGIKLIDVSESGVPQNDISALQELYRPVIVIGKQ